MKKEFFLLGLHAINKKPIYNLYRYPYYSRFTDAKVLSVFSSLLSTFKKKSSSRILYAFSIFRFFNIFLNYYFLILKKDVLTLKTQKLRVKNNFFLLIILIYKIKFAIYKHLMVKLGHTPALFFSKTRVRRKKIPLISPAHLITKIIQWMSFNVKKLTAKDSLLKALHKELLNSFIFSFLGFYKLKVTKPKKISLINRLKRKKKVTFKR